MRWLLAFLLSLSLSVGAAHAQSSAGGPLWMPIAPGGRISDNTTSCSHITDSTTVTTLYYLPCVANNLPISPDGVTLVQWQIPSTATTLSTANSGNFPANDIFDFYAFINSGAVTYCAVRWGTSTAGSSSRGGSAGITTVNGITVNSGTWTCLNGSTSYTLVTKEATLLGSFFISSTAQDINVSFAPAASSGGVLCSIGYANVYNAQSATCMSRDSKTTWTYNSTTIAQLDGSTANQVDWIDPLGANPYWAQLTDGVQVATANDNAQVGVGINSTTAFSGIVGSATYTHTTTLVGVASGIAPQSGGGLNYAAALAQGYNGTIVCTFYGTGGTNTPQIEGLVLTTLY